MNKVKTLDERIAAPLTNIKNLVVHVMPDVDLTSYDWIVVNSSAGKDSQAMLSDMVRRCDALGIDRSRIVVAHADLGRIEWEGTKALAKAQADAFGVRFEAEKRPQGDLLHQVEFERKMWPSSTCRYCTSDHKRGQVLKILTRLTEETRATLPKDVEIMATVRVKDEDGNWIKVQRPRMVERPVRILNCMGIRSQESPARSIKNPFEYNAKASGKGLVKHVDTYYPIFDWTENAVWAEIKRSEVEHHMAYDLGMGRLSCVFCVFAPKSMLMIAGEHNRELLEEYVAVEERIGHTFRKGFKIAEVRDALDRGETADVLGDEDIKCWNM